MAVSGLEPAYPDHKSSAKTKKQHTSQQYQHGNKEQNYDKWKDGINYKNL